MRGHYSIRNPVANRVLRILDAVLRLIYRHRVPPTIPADVRRILISNIAHLGDIIVATSVLPALQDRFPGVEFGFLVGSWCVPILEGHPLVARCHVLDHWMHTRAKVPFREKWRIYQRTRTKALREIKAVKYDLAIDLYWNMPNTLPFLKQTGIPIRAGYGSAGFGPLATHCLELSESRDHISERHRKLLALLSVENHSLSLMQPVLSPVSAEMQGQMAERLRKFGIKLRNYIVFHPGASTPLKEWPEERWRALAIHFTKAGHNIIFTGHGVVEEAMITRVMASLPGCVNLCGRLKWSSFVCIIQEAQLLVSVDTVAGHIAGAVGTPSQVLTIGRNPYLWKPMGGRSQMLMAPVPCAPCHRNYGCAGMECMRDVTVEHVIQACLHSMKQP